MRENLRNMKFLTVLLIGLTAAITFVCCNRNYASSEEDDYECECEVIEDTIAPNELYFMSVGEAIEFQNQMVKEYQINEVFRSISETTLRSVVSVLLARDKANGGIDCVTKKDIVYEYLNNKDIYDNLEVINKPDTSVVLSYKYKTDTTDSGVRRELIKEETHR